MLIVELKLLNPTMFIRHIEDAFIAMFNDGHELMKYVREYFFYLVNLEYRVLHAVYECIGDEGMKEFSDRIDPLLCNNAQFCKRVWRNEPIKRDDVLNSLARPLTRNLKRKMIDGNP